VSKNVVDALYALVEAGLPMTLVRSDTSYEVIWRHEDKPPLAVIPLCEESDPDADSLYAIELKFHIMEILS
ncbi:MAG: hypothetical protein GY862_07695, partial [Gammaproteobacteria bacterium]|nr:hypothetical protein [Gammaproteobacteria bacterium]